MTADENGPGQPVFQVVAGHPTDEETAALSVLLTVLRRGRAKPHAPATSAVAGGWKSYWHLMQQGLIPGREAWRSTFRR